MTSYPVKVGSLSPTTTQQGLHDFFSFCGTIKSIRIEQEKKGATIEFENISAARTALMLNGGTLDGSTISVTSDAVQSEVDAPGATSTTTEGTATAFEQSDKPRAGIAAEYLARGYELHEHILQRAIDIDQKQGISTKFLSYLSGLDKTVGSKVLGPDQLVSTKVQETVTQATTQAKQYDEQKGITKSASDYFSKAISSPFGSKVWKFYTDTQKQVLDIHEEAKRIQEHHKAQAAQNAAPGAGATPASTLGSGVV